MVLHASAYSTGTDFKEDVLVAPVGNGTLTIGSGGELSNSIGTVGWLPGSMGTATVKGTGSKWTNMVFQIVGHEGNGTLRVEAGGAVSDVTGYLGYLPGSSGTGTVTGAGSKRTSGTLNVGIEGNGTLRIEAKGLVSSTFGNVGWKPSSWGKPKPIRVPGQTSCPLSLSGGRMLLFYSQREQTLKTGLEPAVIYPSCRL